MLKEGIDIASQTWSRCSIEIANALLQSYAASGVGPSRVVCPEDMGDLEEVDLKDEIIFNIEADLEANGTIRISLWLSLVQCLLVKISIGFGFGRGLH